MRSAAIPSSEESGFLFCFLSSFTLLSFCEVFPTSVLAQICKGSSIECETRLFNQSMLLSKTATLSRWWLRFSLRTTVREQGTSLAWESFPTDRSIWATFSTHPCIWPSPVSCKQRWSPMRWRECTRSAPPSGRRTRTPLVICASFGWWNRRCALPTCRTWWRWERSICFARHESRVIVEAAKSLLNKHESDLAFLQRRVENSLFEQLRTLENGREYCHLTYSEAIDVLTRKGLRFEVPVKWGIDLQSEHERYLCEQYCGNRPLFLTHYPTEIKPFYMRETGDGRTVEAVDLLVPRVVGVSGDDEQ